VFPNAKLSNYYYAELSEKEISNVTDESFTVGDVTKGAFISIKLSGKRSKSYV
jgi:hypothetical protein